MTIALWTFVCVVAAALAYLAVRPLLRTYLTYRGTRVVTCPETGRPAAVEVDARFAAVSQASSGAPVLRLATCSRWPERQSCDQPCLAQIEAAPEDCRVRAMLDGWYAGRACALCRQPFPEIHWTDHKPALRAPTGDTVTWAEIRAEDLPAVLATHAPVCWNCHIAETFRHRHPELVVEAGAPRPASHAR
jgi:hypothetical protein